MLLYLVSLLYADLCGPASLPLYASDACLESDGVVSSRFGEDADRFCDGVNETRCERAGMLNLYREPEIALKVLAERRFSGGMVVSETFKNVARVPSVQDNNLHCVEILGAHHPLYNVGIQYSDALHEKLV